MIDDRPGGSVRPPPFGACPRNADLFDWPQHVLIAALFHEDKN